MDGKRILFIMPNNGNPFCSSIFSISTLDPNAWAITFTVGLHNMERLKLPLFYMKHAFEVGFRPRIL
jgi:hypothetical protein